MFMVNYIAEHLRKSGYKVSKFVRLPNNGIIDVYAERNGEIIIAECILRPTRRLIEEKNKEIQEIWKTNNCDSRIIFQSILKKKM